MRELVNQELILRTFVRKVWQIHIIMFLQRKIRLVERLRKEFLRCEVRLGSLRRGKENNSKRLRIRKWKR